MEHGNLIDKEMLQKIQDKFCYLGNISAYCVDEFGDRISEWSGEAEDIAFFQEASVDEQLLALFEKVRESTLEEQIIEDTTYGNLKVAAIGYKLESKLILCWLACCVFSPDTAYIQAPCVRGAKRVTTEERFYETISLFQIYADQIYHARHSVEVVKAEHVKSLSTKDEMEKSLKRAEYYTDALQLLETEKSFEEAAGDILSLMGRYLDISSAGIVKICKNEKHMDVVGEWLNDSVPSLYDRVKDLERPGLLYTDKTVIISNDTMISKETKDFLKKMNCKAYIAVPLYLEDKVSLYVYLEERRQKRNWQLEEIHFIKDMTRIMQGMLSKAVQKKSLESSYASLQAILDNVGSCIYVQDVESGGLIFANCQMKNTFELEMNNGRLLELVQNGRPIGFKEGYYEIHYREKNRWYDLCYTYITWVDGRRVALCALYDITDKKIYQNKIEQQAYTDFLTGLYNRMCCERDLSMQLDKAIAKNITGGLLYLDLDDFKHINDGLGHQYGDVLLKSISNSLRRIEGICDTCYRMGGDEFVIIIPPESFFRFEQIIQEILEVFSKPWFLKDADYYCTMSMGIVTYPEDGDSVQDLIKKADIAMYEAKKSGKNRYFRYSDKLGMVSHKRLDMEKNMRDATADNYQEFVVYYQPIIDILSEKPVCTGAEALIRWNSSTMGFVPPSEFIPLAEYLGLINPIGNYVLREACIACKSWNDSGMSSFKVNVNLSVVQLLQTDIVEVVEKTIKETGINPANLTLEVTESLAINDMNRMKKILNRIRNLGVRIALDDFGTGYSSLNHIREIPLDVIKVDQNFVQGLAEDSYSQSFIKMVAELATAIGVNVCVEGIETAEQFKVVNDLKIQLIQGYYFDRPLPRRDFEEKYVISDVKGL